MTPEGMLLLAWLEEAEAPAWVMDGVADALPKVESGAREAARSLQPLHKATLDFMADQLEQATAEAKRLRSALAPWVRDVPWVPLALEGARILSWECYACEATITLPPRPLSLTGPDEAWHIDGSGREERCRWLVSRAALAAQPAAPERCDACWANFVDGFCTKHDPSAQPAAPESEPERCAFEALPGHGRCDLTRDDAEHHGCNNPRCLHDGRRRGYNCHPFRSAARPLTPAPR